MVEMVVVWDSEGADKRGAAAGLCADCGFVHIALVNPMMTEGEGNTAALHPVLAMHPLHAVAFAKNILAAVEQLMLRELLPKERD